MAIKVLLADDHLIVLRGLQFFLEQQEGIRIVGHAMNGREAVEKVGQLRPDVVLMDIRMPDMDGIEATRMIRQSFPDVKVIILTSFSDQDAVIPAIRSGAAGYQLKDVHPRMLVQTIHAAIGGNQVFHPQIANQLLAPERQDGQAKWERLTPKEREVLHHITMGQSNKEIAASLGITEKTVKTHVTAILGKMDVEDRTQAAVQAIRNRWFGG